ncbi:MAG TPA: NUDIX hydrolase [Anaeromyxobacter sp.]|nr:NUDIX hydrolase [Anaeromyxobacter sp.]
MALVRAAGGVVWREGSAGRRLAVIHRPDHDDWSLPKGKLDAGESWHQAAVREIAEETGCEARISAFAGAKLFVDRDVPKLVLYWHMRVVRAGALDDDDEVDEVAWLSPREALSRLDHASDRRLLLRALAGWRRPGERGSALAREALRELVVVDRRCGEDELAPFLRVIERTIDGQGRRGARLASSARR